MGEQDFEFLIMQYLDGELAGPERAALEKRLAGDPQAAAMLESYRKLDAAMKGNAAVPAVRWEVLAKRISTALDRQGEPVQSYRIFSFRAASLAAAAMVLLAFGVFIIQRHGTGAGEMAVKPPTAQQVADVDVMPVEGPASGEHGVADVSISPPPQSAIRVEAMDEDGVTVRPSRISIAGDPELNGPQPNTQ